LADCGRAGSHAANSGTRSAAIATNPTFIGPSGTGSTIAYASRDTVSEPFVGFTLLLTCLGNQPSNNGTDRIGHWAKG
jgi:hypothetical protein